MSYLKHEKEEGTFRLGVPFDIKVTCPTCGAGERCFMQPSGKTYGNTIHTTRGDRDREARSERHRGAG